MSLMKIHRSNESFWSCGMLLVLLLLVVAETATIATAATSTTTTAIATADSETQTSATNGAIRQQQQQQLSADEAVDHRNESNSAEILSPSDVDVVAEKPTTYRPTGSNRPSIAPLNSAQERERKLMNVLAARRTALHRGGFRTRIGTTGRSATSPVGAAAAVESTSKAPSDPRSVCIRNCTKNFTRRTTASCMRQCANFTRMAMAGTVVASATNNNNGSVVLRTASKATGVAAGERDTNEILFSDESSHGLFVVAKEQNDTLNHIADGAKPPSIVSKQRGRGKPAVATVTVRATSSAEQLDEEEDDDAEEDELQPYLFFGAKLPPLKPGALTITAADDDDQQHPRVLEVSVLPSSSTTSTTTPQPAVESTAKPTVSTRRPLTEVERSRSRYKYHMRERGVAPSVVAAPPPPPAPPVSRTRYVGSGRPTAGLAESSLEQKQSEVAVVESQKPLQATRRLVGKPQPSSTPLIITVLSAEEEATTSSSTPSTTTSTTTTSTTPTEPPSTTQKATTTTSTSTSTSTTSTTTTSTTPSTTTSSTSTSTTTTTPAPTTTSTTSTTTTSTATTTTPSTTTPKQRDIIEEDTERLRALGPSLTQEINVEDQNNLIIFCNSTANCEATPRTQISHTTDSTSKILRTTVLTSVRSTVNPRPTSTATPPRAPPAAPPAAPVKPINVGNAFIGIVESSSSSASPMDISSTAIADERDANIDVRRMNLVTLVLVAVGVVPLAAIVLYLVRNYIVRRQAKQDEVFDVCIADQQPISPVKKVDSKYQLDHDEDEVDHQHHHHQQQQQQQQQAMPMSNSQQQHPSRDANHNRYDDKTSLTSEYQEFERSNIRLKSLLGEGNFGQVWKAEADDLSGHFGATRIVAVKTIRACSAQVSLKDEANIMRKLGSHQNVVTLLGACVESEPHMLIMEYAMRGRLLSLLRAARSATNILPASVPGGRSLAPLSPRTLAGFALDIACGMEYIAGRRIVHRDLAARNVLLDHNGMCKICDFGMSIDLDAERMRKEQEKNAANDILRSNAQKFKFDFGSRYILQHWQHTFGQGQQGNCSKDAHAHGAGEKKSHGHDTIGKRHALPIRWMAPESLQFHMFTTETDIWAFGIVLWEIATLGSTPYSHLTGREVIRRVPQGLRPELPKESRHEFYNLMSRCWHKEPHMRPSFAQSRLEIARSLHKWVDDDSAASDYMDVSGFSEDLEHGVVYFNHRISEFECEI